MSPHRILEAAAVAALAGLALPHTAAAQAPRIPLERGLTLSYVTSLKGEPDFEEIILVEAADSNAVQLRISWNRGDRHWKSARRPVSRRERLLGRSFYTYARPNERDQHRGYAYSMATGAVLTALEREGRSEVALLIPNLDPAAPYRGTLTRVGARPEPFSLLLDGQRVSVGAIRASGVLENLAAGETSIRAEFLFLDDPQAPWYLDEALQAGGRAGHTRLVRIGTSRAEADLAAALRMRCEAHVSDIFFATGSAEVDSASVPTFQRIAAVLAANPGWRIMLVGHTDSIGDDAANLALSRHRAEAARSALLRDYHIPATRLTADGRGEREPLEDNATEQGRARNRRVDLVRRCR